MSQTQSRSNQLESYEQLLALPFVTLTASSRYCVTADEWVKNVLWDFSKQTVFFKDNPSVSRAQQAQVWLTEYQPASPSVFFPLFFFFSDIRALIFSPCLKWAVNCHGSVTGLFFFPPFFFHLTESTANHCFAPKWLITASLFGNMETARGDPSFAAAQSFDAAVISLCVVRALRRTKRHHLRPPSPRCDGEFK